MNKLQEKLKNKLLHVTNDTERNIEIAAKECANITEEIAVKFTEFLQKQYYLEDNDWFDYNSEGIRKLFQEFLKTL